MVGAGQQQDQAVEGSRVDLGFFRRRWMIIALCAVIGVMAGAVQARSATEKYKAEADVIVTPLQSGDALSDTLAGIPLLRAPGATVFTAARLVEEPRVLDAVRSAPELSDRNYTRDQLRKMITVDPIQQSGVVAVSVDSPDPAQARTIANLLARTLVEQRTDDFQAALAPQIARVQSRIAEIKLPAGVTDTPELIALNQNLAALKAFTGSPDPTVAIWSTASLPEHPDSVLPLGIAIAGLIGLLIGIALALLIDRVDPKVRTGSPVLSRLTVLGRVRRIDDDPVELALDPGSRLPAPLFEAYYSLRANLNTVKTTGAQTGTVVVTSGGTGEGKTSAAVNFAVALAETGSRVALVDADVLSPSIAQAFRVRPQSESIDSLLASGAVIPSPAYRERLSLIVPRDLGNAPREFLDPMALRAGLKKLRASFDVVIIDTPGMIEVGDALVWATVADFTIVAVREGHSRIDNVELASNVLTSNSVKGGYFVVGSRPIRESVFSWFRSLGSRVTTSRDPVERVENVRSTAPGGATN